MIDYEAVRGERQAKRQHLDLPRRLMFRLASFLQNGNDNRGKEGSFDLKGKGIVLAVFVLAAGCLLPGSSGVAHAGPGTAAAATKQGAEPAANVRQVLRLNVEEPATLDPSHAEDTVSGAMIRAIFDGLTRLDENGEPMLSLASDMRVSADKLTYTFTLRDARWSNGDPVTASDFEFAWKHALDPRTGSSAAYNYYILKNGQAFASGKAQADGVGVRALDDKTLRVRLEYPAPFFPTMAASLPPINRKLAEANSQWANDPRTLVGNGPFKLATWEHKNKIILVKSDTYWDKEAVKLERIEFSMIADANTELAMFERGDLDWAGGPIGGLPVDAIAPLKQEGKLKTKAKATSYYIRFHTEHPPFTNAKIRKAFAYAINRREIADYIGQAGQTPLMGITPRTATLKPEGFFADDQPEKAKQLLAEGMRELGMAKLPPITYLYNISERNKAIAETLQARWKNVLGAEVKLLAKETKVFLTDQERGKFDITRSGWTADYNDPINFLQKFVEKNSSSNITRWHSPHYARLIRLAQAEADPEKRNRILLEAETLLMEEMPLTGLFSDMNTWVQSDKVKGVRIDPLGKLDLKWAYME